MFCTKCGNQVSDTAVFCTKCGNKLKNKTSEVNNSLNINSEFKAEEDSRRALEAEMARKAAEERADREIRAAHEAHDKAILAEARAIEAEKAKQAAEERANEKTKEVEEMKAAEEARLEKERLAKEAEKNKRSDLEKALNNIQNRQKRCPHCGALILNESQFCKNCGASL